MKKIKKLLSLQLIITAALITLSCNEPEESLNSQQVSFIKPVTILDDRLNFASKEIFKNYMTELVETNSNSKIILEKYIGNGQFKSLRDIRDEKTLTLARTESDSADLIEADTLVNDPHFESILNENHEIQVEGTLYKVTPYGTYICIPEKRDRVNEILASLFLNNFELTPMNRAIPGEQKQSENMYFVEAGIYRLDSFNDSQKIEIINSESETTGSSNGRETTNDLLPQYIYDQFPTYNFDAKTWAGSLLQDVFGRTKPHTEKFDSKHRVKVNFYNVNFGVYASAGINVKTQRKGWTGIWRSDDAEELRLGWDGLIIDLMLPNAPQPNIPTVDFGKVKLGDINFATHSISVAGYTIPKGKINDALNGVLEGQFRNALNEIYNYAFITLAPGQFQYKEDYVKMFRVVYPDRIKLVFGKYEVAENNTNSISKVFDWNAGLTVKWKPNGTSVDTQDFSASGSATAYKIISGSVYGAGKHDNIWKGARVDKN